MEPQTQTWVSSPFNIERRQGKNSGTQIIAFSGPFTARDMYGSLTPDAMRGMLQFSAEQATETITVSIFDLSQVPYVDSSGLGMIVRHFAHCRGKGIRFVAAGVSPRVLQLFKLTKVDAIIPMSATVEEAESN
jgi:anti-anti-sigma factor